MPLGKSGNYYMNPHEMRRKGDMPGAAKPTSGHVEHGSGAEDRADSGDGQHHHELHEHEDGTLHSVHTHPDGRQEEADHADYPEARDHMDDMWGESHDTEEDGDDGGPRMPMGHESDDMAGMYEKAGRRG